MGLNMPNPINYLLPLAALVMFVKAAAPYCLVHMFLSFKLSHPKRCFDICPFEQMLIESLKKGLGHYIITSVLLVKHISMANITSSRFVLKVYSRH